MKIVFMGTPDFAVETLHLLVESAHEIVGVVTRPDKAKGRRKVLLPSPVKEEALRQNLAVYQPEKVRDPVFVRQLALLEPDVIVVAAFGQIIPAEILQMPKYGCLNVHASLLPKYRGAAPIQWAVIDGEKESGVTIMQMDEGLDTGDILAQEKVVLSEDETGGSLFDRLSETGAELLVRTLPALEEGTLQPIRQPAESPTRYASMLTKQMGCIDWNQDAHRIACLIRGMNPWPSAYTYLNGKMLKIWKAEAVDTGEQGQPGCVTELTRTTFTVAASTGALRIHRLQLEGKKEMDTAQFLRGYQLTTGVVLTQKRE